MCSVLLFIIETLQKQLFLVYFLKEAEIILCKIYRNRNTHRILAELETQVEILVCGQKYRKPACFTPKKEVYPSSPRSSACHVGKKYLTRNAHVSLE